MANSSEASGFFFIKLKSSWKMKGVKNYGNWLMSVGPTLRFPRYPSFWERGKSSLAITKLTQELELGDCQET